MHCRSLFIRLIPHTTTGIPRLFPSVSSYSTKRPSEQSKGSFIVVPEDKINIDINRYKAVGGIISKPLLHIPRKRSS